MNFIFFGFVIFIIVFLLLSWFVNTSSKKIAKFSTWLYTIAGNLAKTELRKLKRRKTYSVSDLSRYDHEFVIKSPDGSAEIDAESITIEKSIQHALNQLPIDFKKVLKENYLKNFK